MLRGLYTLVGVVSHRGRDADSGHYVSWVRQDALSEAAVFAASSGNPAAIARAAQQAAEASALAGSMERAERAEHAKWWLFDDDRVSEVTAQQILDLKGGGDWHTGYLLFYRAE